MVGVICEAVEQVFLEGLTGCCRSSAKYGVHVIGNVFHLDTRHVSSVAPYWRCSMPGGAICMKALALVLSGSSNSPNTEGIEYREIKDIPSKNSRCLQE